MVSIQRTRVGIQAGLMAGGAIIAIFFLFDLATLQPLATPVALSTRLLGPSSPVVDAPVVSQLVSLTIFGGNLLALTVLHFLAFSVLGVGAVWGCEECRLPLNLVTGAVYGLTIGSLAFFGCLALFGNHVLTDLPGPLTIAFANLCAGAVLGGAFQKLGPRPPL